MFLYFELESMAFIYSDDRIVILNAKEVTRIGRKRSGTDSYMYSYLIDLINDNGFEGTYSSLLKWLTP